MKIFEVGVDTTTRAFLRSNGFALIHEEVETPEDLYEWLVDGAFEAAVIDIEKTNWGTFAVRFLRSKNLLIPVIGLSGSREDISWSEQRAVFLENGGDDFLRSPPNPRELAASLRAVTRRGKGLVIDVREFTAGDAVIRVNLSLQVVTVNGITVPLTPKEMLVMMVLASSHGRIQTKGQILDGLYSAIEDEAEIKIVDVFICKIRKKLDDAHEGAGKIIQTIWGRGYDMKSRSDQSKSEVA